MTRADPLALHTTLTSVNVREIEEGGGELLRVPTCLAKSVMCFPHSRRTQNPLKAESGFWVVAFVFFIRFYEKGNHNGQESSCLKVL